MGVIVVVVIGVAVLVGVAVLLAMTDGGINDEPVDRIDDGLPDRPLRAADLPGLRFRIGLRGYRMDDVDAALSRIHSAMLAAEDPDGDRVSTDAAGAD